MQIKLIKINIFINYTILFTEKLNYDYSLKNIEEGYDEKL
jgi:hypothetical protein